jgi:hypothetical protein
MSSIAMSLDQPLPFVATIWICTSFPENLSKLMAAASHLLPLFPDIFHTDSISTKTSRVPMVDPYM